MTKDLTETFTGFLYDQGDRIGLLKQVLATLGNPDTDFSIIHVCGTNGKGSTSLMIAAILQQMGYRVGLFTSPFIGDVTNSVQVNQKPISQRRLTTYFDSLKQTMATATFNQQQLSEFEALFVAAMMAFSDEKVDYVVLECGLGGELDATNAVKTTMYSIFTKIGMDHVGILGDTIEQIATTKSKIIRPHNTTISAPNQRPEALQIIKKEAEQKAANFLDAADLTVSFYPKTSMVAYQIGHKQGQFTFGLQGAYQLENVRTVVRWLLSFASDRPTIELDRLLSQSLGKLNVPGRFELISDQPRLILDGAHNVDAITAFVQTVNQQFQSQQKLIITGFLADKDYADNIKLLSQIPNAAFWLTTPDNEQRQLDPVILQKLLATQTGVTYPVIADPIQALKAAVKEAASQPDTVIFVVWSFYLLNPIRTFILENRSDFHVPNTTPSL